MSKVKYSKQCPNCGKDQFYGRLDHYKSAINGNWSCKSCSSHFNNFRGKYKDIPLTWLNVKKRSGISRGYDWNLTIEFIWDLYLKQDKKCALSGLPIGWAKKGLTSTASIDRIDNNKGYIVGNVQLLHKDVNFMKQKFDQEYFISVCKMITNREKW